MSRVTLDLRDFESRQSGGIEFKPADNATVELARKALDDRMKARDAEFFALPDIRLRVKG